MGSAPHTQVEAQVPAPAPKDHGPFAADQVIPTILVFLIAALGGLVSFYRKWKAKKVRAFNVVELIGELVVSGICGVIGYWLLKGSGVNEYLIAGAVGVIGHMGSRFLFMLEEAAEEKLQQTLGKAIDPSADLMDKK